MKDLGSLMKQAQAMQEKLQEAQSRLAETVVEGASGGGMVKLTLKGSGELRSVEIDPDLLKPEDAEMVSDLIVAAHADAKAAMLVAVASRTGVELDPSVLTIAVARRAASYKRTDLLLSDPDRLRRVVDHSGPIQIVYSGKAHPADKDGKGLIERMPARRRYECRPPQLRVLCAYVILREQVIKPVLAGLAQEQLPPPPPKLAPIDQHYLNLRAEFHRTCQIIGRVEMCTFLK